MSSEDIWEAAWNLAFTTGMNVRYYQAASAAFAAEAKALSVMIGIGLASCLLVALLPSRAAWVKWAWCATLIVTCMPAWKLAGVSKDRDHHRAMYDQWSMLDDNADELLARCYAGRFDNGETTYTQLLEKKKSLDELERGRAVDRELLVRCHNEEEKSQLELHEDLTKQEGPSK